MSGTPRVIRTTLSILALAVFASALAITPRGGATTSPLTFGAPSR